MLKLYTGTESVHGQRVQIMLKEKQVPCEIRDLDQLEGSAPMRTVSSSLFGRVPVLDDDGFLLSESTAILQYIEAQYPTPALIPSDARSKAMATMYVVQCDVELGVPIGKVVTSQRAGASSAPTPAGTVERARAEILQHLTSLERQLGTKSFMLGDSFGLAEISYAPLLVRLAEVAVTPPPGLVPWLRRILDRPSVRAVVGVK